MYNEKITFSRTHSNAYRIWGHSDTGGKRSIGTVAKLDGVWKIRRHTDDGVLIFEGPTRMEAVTRAFCHILNCPVN